MGGRARKQCIFWSCNTSAFNAMRCGESSFTCQCQKKEKEKKNGWRVSNFALLMVVFKCHHGGEACFTVSTLVRSATPFNIAALSPEGHSRQRRQSAGRAPFEGDPALLSSHLRWHSVMPVGRSVALRPQKP